jgi:hypothetical protein
VLMLSCSKKGDKNAGCRIVTAMHVTAFGNTIYTLTYSDEDKLSGLAATGGAVFNKAFSYNGNTTIVNTTNETGDFMSRDSITVNDKGRVVNMRNFITQNGSEWINYSFTYSGDDLVAVEQTRQPAEPPVSGVGNSLNGNLLSLSSATASTIFEYYLDKKVQQGDYLDFSLVLQFGAGIYPHKNLIKTISTGATITNFTYEFNSDGLISKVAINNGSTIQTVTYQYKCD